MVHVSNATRVPFQVLATHYSIGIVGVHQNLESDIRRLEQKQLPARQVRSNQQNAAYDSRSGLA